MGWIPTKYRDLAEGNRVWIPEDRINGVISTINIAGMYIIIRLDSSTKIITNWWRMNFYDRGVFDNDEIDVYKEG